MILDELRYLHTLLVKNVRHLLHLLATSVTKARASVLELLNKYFSLVFADSPAKVHEAMVDFNHWLLEVLADTRSEGIEWGPSYGENPWLALEQQDQQSGTSQIDEVFTLDATNTIQLLRTSREHYMTRCDSLQQTNADVTMQLEQLEIQFKEALFRAFESQQNLCRERELTALREKHLVLGVQLGAYLAQQNTRIDHPIDLNQQIASAFSMLNVLSSAAIPSGDSTSANDLEEKTSAADIDVEPVQDREAGGTDMGASILVDQVELVAQSSREVEAESPQQDTVAPSSNDQFALDPTASSPSGCNYQQLIQLNASEEKNSSWYRQALRKLKEEREQRRFLRKPSDKATEASVVASPTLRKIDVEAASLDLYKPLEFHELAAIRVPTDDAATGDSTWYHKALQQLEQERKHRASLRRRTESFSSTISIVD
ncbi:uncharacterized protein IUM83_12672 [Phytophthora cinnamomi]|uniref:uncharacterized protein n=1 Tax=Phytophthora cinnamomi TaxID=4785 RepID=UPI00355A837C|nr:hypothetical protein IUM83_12672 [Phytophthora cinnamomi]